MSGARTYWHLQSARRIPSDYEVVTSRLLYQEERGFEVATPVLTWREKHGKGSPLKAKDWERFQDPRESTYSVYVEAQSRRETFVDGLLRSVDETGYDLRLEPEWVDTLDRVLPVLGFPIHGLQMVAAYLGQLAPSGKVVVCALLQAADEVRRIQRLAYRCRQLQGVREGFGRGARSTWQGAPEWQPLRRLVETLLVTWDFGEALVALSQAVKPLFDAFFMSDLARLAERKGDQVLGKMLFSLEEDCRWHRQWSDALLRLALEDAPENELLVGPWREKWRKETTTALDALRPGLGLAGGGSG